MKACTPRPPSACAMAARMRASFSSPPAGAAGAAAAGATADMAAMRGAPEAAVVGRGEACRDACRSLHGVMGRWRSAAGACRELPKGSAPLTTAWLPTLAAGARSSAGEALRNVRPRRCATEVSRLVPRAASIAQRVGRDRGINNNVAIGHQRAKQANPRAHKCDTRVGCSWPSRHAAWARNASHTHSGSKQSGVATFRHPPTPPREVCRSPPPALPSLQALCLRDLHARWLL